MTDNILKATHQGTLKIGERQLACAVLEDGTRVISRNAIFRAFGRTKRGRKKDEIRVPNMPSFIDANNLQPFIGEDLRRELRQIRFRNINGRLVPGFNAKILPLICDVYLAARSAGILTWQQLPLAAASEILVRSFSKIGIIALVDEATGYQEIRDRLALQRILDQYLTDEWAEWTKTFPDEYYKELFKLKGVPYPPTSRNRPSYVEHWTNDIVYSRLAPGVLNELKNKNPRQPTGHRRRRHHQYLTRDYGHPVLKEHLSNIIFLMKSCTKWDDFKRRLSRASPKYGDTIPLPFPETED
ncbi:MAG: P63C domain-containing protein [Candidatus Hodarchaeota archaeon]